MQVAGQPLPFFDDSQLLGLLVQPRVFDGDGCLLGKQIQQVQIRGGELPLGIRCHRGKDPDQPPSNR